MGLECGPLSVNFEPKGVEVGLYQLTLLHQKSIFGINLISGSQFRILEAYFRPLRFAFMDGVIFGALGFDFWPLKVQLGLREVDFWHPRVNFWHLRVDIVLWKWILSLSESILRYLKSTLWVVECSFWALKVDLGPLLANFRPLRINLGHLELNFWPCATLRCARAGTADYSNNWLLS